MNNSNIINNNLFDYNTYYRESDSIKKIEMCLQYISDRLKQRQISVMIGAGYSLNANLKKTNQEQQYEDWLSLLENAYKELYPDNKECINGGNSKEIRNKIQCIGESVIAEQYEKAKGSREALDLYIEKRFLQINQATDDLCLHEKLLSLNWNDIITTNWDHLLERVNNKKNEYFEVLRAKDLRGRPNRRIIKLHGSIRSEKEIENKTYNFDDTYNYLYLITETDFKTYKEDHEDFSNFMKVKILETPFCLMGFSGRDSNFKYWVKELKRTMHKGGNTEHPNPIFLFDVNPKPTDPKDKDYEDTLDLFYSNNHIIRLKILDFYKYLNPQTNSIPNISGGNLPGPSSNPKDLTHSDLNHFILDYLIEKSNTINEDNENKTDDDINQNQTEEKKLEGPQQQKSPINNTPNVISNIASSNMQNLTDSDLKQYNQTEMFDFMNLLTTSSITYKIQNLYSSLNNWTEQTFIFLYRWILGNYYSLTNLYEEEKIQKIIETYFQKKFENTQAYVFLELILKYYREAQKFDEFSSLCEKLNNNSLVKNILSFEQANLLVDKLNYIELKNLLETWTPERDEKTDSIFIIRKLSLLKTFENWYSTESEKESISNMFTTALNKCNENQYKYFIAIFQKQFLQNHSFEINYYNQPLIDSLIQNGVKEVYKYVDNFKNEKPHDNYKSNVSKRYTITQSFGTTSGNESLINTIRIFNFFEYTGLPMSMFFQNSKMIDLVPSIKNTEYYLVKCLIKNISYFGHDSEEDYMRNILNCILRFTSQDNIIGFYRACFDIFKFKFNNSENIRTYLFLVSELTNYISDNDTKDYFDYFITQIQNPNKLNQQLINLIRSGKVWGVDRPFTQLLEKIPDSKTFKIILSWIINEYILDERELVKQEHYTPSSFFSYYFTLIQKIDYEKDIKKLFSETKIIKLLEEDFEYEKQLCLYGFEYLPECLKQKTKEFYENEYTLHTDPFFIKHFKSEKLKEHILTRLGKYNIIAFDSRNYPFSNYLRMLNQEKMLNENDKLTICNIISGYYDQIQKDKDHFKYGFRSLKDTISSLYFCLEDILTEEEKNSVSKIKIAYDKIKNEFINQIKDFYEFKWLYTEDLQQFRLSFSQAISYYSYLHQAKQYLYIFNIVLSKIIVQDDSNFEAVLELFINMYSNSYEDDVFVNQETHNLLIQIMKKFQLDIPYCYDFLFIKKQMKVLASSLRKHEVTNDIIEYWEKQ